MASHKNTREMHCACGRTVTVVDVGRNTVESVTCSNCVHEQLNTAVQLARQKTEVQGAEA